MARRNISSRARSSAELAVVAILFFGMAGIAFWQFQTSFVEQDANTGGPFDNAAMFPRMVAWGLVILGSLEAARLLAGMVAGRPATMAEPLATDEPGRILTLRALISAAVFVLYLWVLPWAGYVAATPVMMVMMMMTLGARWWMAIIAACLATFGIGFVFATVLNVVMPVGRLGLPTVF